MSKSNLHLRADLGFGDKKFRVGLSLIEFE